MTNVSGLRIEDYQDIESVNFAEDRKKEGWEEEKIRTYLARNSRDHARTPMQWNAEKHAGFTSGNTVDGGKSELRGDQCGKQQKKSGFPLLFLIKN